MDPDFLIVRITCNYPGGFVDLSAAVALGTYLDLDFSLASGGDLPRIRDSAAASAGSYRFYVQGCIACILHHELVDYLVSLQHGAKIMGFFRDHRLWACLDGGHRSKRKAANKHPHPH
ncbi:MAG: hypothetical protein R6X08_10885 [Desulfosalsimonadaceae bacterium]